MIVFHYWNSNRLVNKGWHRITMLLLLYKQAFTEQRVFWDTFFFSFGNIISWKWGYSVKAQEGKPFWNDIFFSKLLLCLSLSPFLPHKGVFHCSSHYYKDGIKTSLPETLGFIMCSSLSGEKLVSDTEGVIYLICKFYRTGLMVIFLWKQLYLEPCLALCLTEETCLCQSAMCTNN